MESFAHSFRRKYGKPEDSRYYTHLPDESWHMKVPRTDNTVVKSTHQDVLFHPFDELQLRDLER